MNTVDELLDIIADENNNQEDVAEAYQAIFGKVHLMDQSVWPKINMAITKRWPSKSGLIKVKAMAWRIYGERKNNKIIKITKD